MLNWSNKVLLPPTFILHSKRIKMEYLGSVNIHNIWITKVTFLMYYSAIIYFSKKVLRRHSVGKLSLKQWPLSSNPTWLWCKLYFLVTWVTKFILDWTKWIFDQKQISFSATLPGKLIIQIYLQIISYSEIIKLTFQFLIIRLWKPDSTLSHWNSLWVDYDMGRRGSHISEESLKLYGGWWRGGCLQCVGAGLQLLVAPSPPLRESQQSRKGWRGWERPVAVACDSRIYS